MRIHDAYTRFQPADAKPAHAVDKSAAGRAREAARADADVKVTLSSAAKSSADSSAARIESLRARVANGALAIDPHAIAAKILGDDR